MRSGKVEVCDAHSQRPKDGNQTSKMKGALYIRSADVVTSTPFKGSRAVKHISRSTGLCQQSSFYADLFIVTNVGGTSAAFVAGLESRQTHFKEGR